MSVDDDIVDYLLGEMTAADRARMERAMREDSSLRDEVRRMRPLVGDLEGLPPEAWGEGVAVPALAPLPPLPPLDPIAATPRRHAARRLSLRPAVAVAASIATLAAGVIVGAVVTNRDADAGPPIALTRIGEGEVGASGTARLISSGAGGLRLRVTGLRPSNAAQFYEVWLLDGPQKVVSLGSFRVPRSGTATLTVPIPVALTDFRFIDVSREPTDGVATHSGRSVLRAPTTT